MEADKPELIGKGTFWVPGAGRNRVRGDLYLVGGRHVLDLEGPITDSNPMEISRLREVRGRLNSGVPMVFTDCRHRHGPHGAVVHANRSMRGKLQKQDFRKRFNLVSFEIPIWMDFQDFRPQITHEAGRTVINDSHQEWSFELQDNQSLHIFIGQGSSHRLHGDRQESFNWMATATIESPSSQPAEKLEELARTLELLFGVIAGHPIVAEKRSISFQPSADSFRPDTEFETTHGPPPPVDDSSPIWLRQEAIVPYWAPNFDWGATISGWFKLLRRPSARQAAEILEGHWITREYESSRAFLDYSRSLEILHRDHRARFEMSPDATKTIMQNVPEDWPDRVKNLVRNMLGGGLEYSFKTRLDKLAAELGPLDYLVGNQNQFLAKVRDTRNYQTHLDDKIKSRAWHGRDLSLAAARLALILRCYLLVLAGVDVGLAKFGMASTAHSVGLSDSE